jgi:hypothetical protein
VRAMPVIPLNVDARAGGDVDFNRFGVHGGHHSQYICAGFRSSAVPSSVWIRRRPELDFLCMKAQSPNRTFSEDTC